MQRPLETEPLRSPLLQELYGEGYFHGANSGFAREGYARVHATWQHWMPWVRRELGDGARWLDLGCAYGFLVVEAQTAGFRAVGLDASAYALRQAPAHAPGAAGRVLQAHAEALPFAADSFDVVTAFDLLEHVPAPELLIREAARVLRPGGLFLGATPDPLYFDRDEPTHVSERVPSWWVRELERAGFSVTLRFFQAEYNCELVTRWRGPAPEVSFDDFGVDPVIEVRGDPALRVAARGGVGRVEPDGGRVIEEGAHFHLLNAASVPLALSLELHTREPARIRVTLDGRVVARSAEAASVVRARAILPSGGHALALEVAEGWARLVRLQAHAEPVRREALCLTLPFDLYERYALIAEVLRRLGVGSARLLDVGGTMGAGRGHLAWAGDFLPQHGVTVIDARAVDHPEHRAIAVDGPLPFPDRAFDVVSAQDVLEHVPRAARSAWLDEVWRVTGRFLLLGGPWDTPGVVEADRYLFELIRQSYGYEHGFLAEHLSYGHPDLAEARRFFEGRRATVTVLPSGHLPSWILMQTVNAWLSHPEQDQRYVRANEAFNRAVGLRSVVAPAYRHLLVIDRDGGDHTAACADLVAGSTPDLEAVRAAIAGLAADPTGRGDRAP